MGEGPGSAKVRHALRKVRNLISYEVSRRQRAVPSWTRFSLLRFFTDRDLTPPSFMAGTTPRMI